MDDESRRALAALPMEVLTGWARDYCRAQGEDWPLYPNVRRDFLAYAASWLTDGLSTSDRIEAACLRAALAGQP